LPLKNGKLTPQERKFAQAVAETGDTMHAARAAGIKHPQAHAARMAAREAVQRAVLDIQTARLVNDLLPIALNTLASIMADERAPAGARVSAAKVTLDRSFKLVEEQPDDEQHMWDADRLRQHIDKLERVQRELARPTLDLQAVEGGVFD
jgi:hypothetical protein